MIAGCRGMIGLGTWSRGSATSLGPEFDDLAAPEPIGAHLSPLEPWSPGKPGQGLLIRSSDGGQVSLVLIAVDGEPNLVRLVLHAERQHTIRHGVTGRSVALLHLTEGGYFSLHPPDGRQGELAEIIEDLDPRLRWKNTPEVG
jgi:hypothetical protein